VSDRRAQSAVAVIALTPFDALGRRDETAAPHGAPGPWPRRARSDLAWSLLVGATDALLRRWYRVREFTDDPACLLRIAPASAPHFVRLSDGAQIAEGETVITLHMWNEHLPRFRLLNGPDLRWALDVRRRLMRSFRALARHLNEDPAWREVTGIHACVTFGSRRRRAQIRRAAARFGFELIEDGVRAAGLHEFGEDFLIWAFARAFNPAALRRQRFRRDRTELWMSRESFLARYL
jgi:hypothetical protein